MASPTSRGQVKILYEEKREEAGCVVESIGAAKGIANDMKCMREKTYFSRKLVISFTVEKRKTQSERDKEYCRQSLQQHERATYQTKSMPLRAEAESKSPRRTLQSAS